MEGEKSAREREPGQEEPRQAPPAAAAAAPDAGCGDTPPLGPSKPREEAAPPPAIISDTDGTCSHFDRSEDDMVMFVSLVISQDAPGCQHHLCDNKVEKGSILVCLDCKSHFCIGAGTKDNPQGHARWHANLARHWVALWLDEPETLYCFVCDRRLDMDVTYGGEESPENSSSDSERCAHFPGDEVEIVMVLSEISSSKKVPVCHRQGCPISGRSHIMVCTVCHMHFCTGAHSDKIPQGHARWHALMFQHWVGLWYSNPDEAYCFACENTLSISGKDGIVVDDDADSGASGLPKIHGCLIRGIPNFGNTCYMNALLQCLFVLGKLRARMLGPDAPSGILGMVLRELFVEANNMNNAGRPLDPTKLLACVRMLDSRYIGSDMQDSHELLCSLRDGLDREEKIMRPSKRQDGAPSAVVPTVVDSIFCGQLSVTTTCRCCSYSSASCEVIYDLSAPLPSEWPPPKSTTSPPSNISCSSGETFRIKLFPEVDMTNTQIVEAIAEGTDSQIAGLELGDVVIEKISEPLERDSTEVEQIPWEIVQVPIKVGDLKQHDSSGLDKALSGLEVSVEIKKTHSVKDSAEDKGKAQCNNVVGGEAEDNNSLASIEECLELHFNTELLEWTCENCSKVACHTSITSSKDGEEMMASANENTKLDGDKAEQSDRITCQNEQSSGLNCLAVEGTNKQPECHEGSQEAVPSCVPAEKPVNLLSGQSQNVSTLDQVRGEQVKQDVEEKQKEQKDGNEGATQTHLISKLPPVLAIHLKRSLGPVKVSGHVSFKEILDVGQFMDPSSEDKDNCNYRLVGVIEHRGPSTNVGHWVAYVRRSHEQPGGGSTSWFYASDTNIREVSLEEVLKCEACLLFYERIEE